MVVGRPLTILDQPVDKNTVRKKHIIIQRDRTNTVKIGLSINYLYIHINKKIIKRYINRYKLTVGLHVVLDCNNNLDFQFGCNS